MKDARLLSYDVLLCFGKAKILLFPCFKNVDSVAHDFWFKAKQRHHITYLVDLGGLGVQQVLVVQQKRFLRQNREESIMPHKDSTKRLDLT